MNVLVCVKQVPKEEDMRLDPETKTLIRSGEGVISDLDRYALEMAVRIKEEHGGRVTAISMGPPASAGCLRYSLSVGADEMCLISDRAFGGADAYATAYTLRCALQKLEAARHEKFDLILCGRQASDSDTALVTPELAEMLGLPYTTGAVDYQLDDKYIQIIRETDTGTATLRLQLPAVISVGKAAFKPRQPNLRTKMMANRKEVPVIAFSDLSVDKSNIGAEGSLTSVGSSYIPEHNKDKIVICEATPEEAARKLLALLKAAHQI